METIVYHPIHNKDDKLKYVNKLLPKPPLRLILVGSSGSGKTNAIKNICFNYYRKYYDEIYIWCGSRDDCVEYQRLAKKNKMSEKVNVISSFNLEKIQELYDEIEEDNLYGKEKSNVLFIYDDRVLSLQNKYKSNIIDECFIRGRHANISTIISTQRYRLLNPNLRCCNANCIIVFPSNRHELQAIAEEHSNLEEPKIFLQQLQKHLTKRFNFIVIDITKPPNERFRNSKFELIEN